MKGLPSGVSAKYDAGAQVAHDEFVCLHRNENLFARDAWPRERVMEALAGVRLETYPDPTYVELREEIGAMYEVGPERVFVGNGSDEVLADVLGLLRREYTSVHVPDVCFRVYYLLADRLDFRIEVLPGRTFETGRIEADGAAKLAVVDSPNAVTGVRAEDGDLRALAEPGGSFLLWDNAYGEYADEDDPIPWSDNVLVVRSFSKYYALAGARVGYCIGGADLVGELMDRKDVFNVNVLGYALARAAVRERERFRPLVEKTRACRAKLVGYLEEMGFSVHPSSGCAVLATHRDCTAAAIQAGLLDRGIAVRRFEGPLTGNSIRITVAPEPTIDFLAEHLAEVLKSHDGQHD